MPCTSVNMFSCVRCQGFHFQGYKSIMWKWGIRPPDVTTWRMCPLWRWWRWNHSTLCDLCWVTALRRWRAEMKCCSRGACAARYEIAPTCALNKQKLDPFILIRFYHFLLRQYSLKYEEESLMYFKYTVNSNDVGIFFTFNFLRYKLFMWTPCFAHFVEHAL